MEYTQQQSHDEQERAKHLSRQRTQPPLEIPGYQWRDYLGSGAYGEVWVAMDQNTGRQLAVKIYTHQGGVDWSLLSREVEKLVFLSTDRYVVQLLDVGWDSNPPYFVMEYVENGSLESYLKDHGSLSVGEAVELFRGLTTGVLHAHSKGVLHCDLKPANVLLDQDNHPRLADFGQSRLSHEQTPALGTLFYMAPEQADLEAVPDARWDVYALGAILYCMLTGEPPYRSDNAVSEIDCAPHLVDRLERYRRFIAAAAPPNKHRRVRGMDSALANLIDRCLAIDPGERFANVQSVVDALQSRDALRDRRPLLLLGLVGPLLFLVVAVWFARNGYQQAVRESDRLLFELARESNGFAADFVSEAVARRIESYFRAVEQVAADTDFRQSVERVSTELGGLLDQLRQPGGDTPHKLAVREEFIKHPARQPLQNTIRDLLDDPGRTEVASWFVADRYGYHLAAEFDTPSEPPVGKDYSWRTYFHGGPDDLSENSRGAPVTPISQTHLSTVFKSKATGAWKIAVSTPVRSATGDFLGVVALTVELGRLGELLGGGNGKRQFNVLVDGREGESKGVVLQHPLFERILATNRHLPEAFSTDPTYRVRVDQWDPQQVYRDPLGQHPLGSMYSGSWIAAKRDVRQVRSKVESSGANPQMVDTGLIVLVQEDYGLAEAPVRNLARWLVRQGVMALLSIIVVVAALWYVVFRAVRDPNERMRRGGTTRSGLSSLQTMKTVELPSRLQK